MRRPVAITGAGMVTCLGSDLKQSWSRLVAGCSGIRPITRFSAEHLKTRIAGSVDFLSETDCDNFELNERIAERALGEAIATAGLTGETAIPAPLYWGYPGPDMDWEMLRKHAREIVGRTECDQESFHLMHDSRLSRQDRAQLFSKLMIGDIGYSLCDRYRISGPSIPLSTACASGGSAIHLAVQSIRHGRTSIAIAGAVDCSVSQESLIRFSLLSALSTTNDPCVGASKPFSKGRDGFVLAEGAAFLILESEDSARARGAQILAYVLGVGGSSDAYHRTRSSPNGEGPVLCMRNALRDANIAESDVQYVNAHGTSTFENDRTETLALRQVFGKHAYSLAISSNKSMLGHALTAAGAIEAVATVMTLREGILPPTINYSPDPELDLDYVPNVARQHEASIAISNSFGFGGQNATVVFAR